MSKTTLTLTSPTAKGPLVLKTQKLLASAGFKPGALDSEYGPSTAAAVRRAKWALGYPEKQVNESAGDFLRGYLAGASTPLAYRIRAKQRKNVVKGLGVKSLILASSFLGYKETPAGTNLNQFGAWYGANGWPWCAEFVSYCLAKSGYKYIDPKNARWAYCPYVLRDARAGHFGLSVISFARATELAHPDANGNRACIITLYDWDNDGVADHIGFFEHATGIQTFTAIEGNTSHGNNSNGGEVMRRDRNVNDVIAFILVAE